MKSETNNHGCKPKLKSKLQRGTPSAARDCEVRRQVDSTCRFQCASLSESEFHNKLTRCPRLGQEIKFPYCLQESGKLPCARIVNCWSPSFDVEALLKEKLTPEEWQSFISLKPKDKVLSLIELIEAAKAKQSRV